MHACSSQFRYTNCCRYILSYIFGDVSYNEAFAQCSLSDSSLEISSLKCIWEVTSANSIQYTVILLSICIQADQKWLLSIFYYSLVTLLTQYTLLCLLFCYKIIRQSIKYLKVYSIVETLCLCIWEMANTSVFANSRVWCLYEVATLSKNNWSVQCGVTLIVAVCHHFIAHWHNTDVHANIKRSKLQLSRNSFVISAKRKCCGSALDTGLIQMEGWAL